MDGPEQRYPNSGRELKSYRVYHEIWLFGEMEQVF